jgi:glycosyltransferase involved in cell wall biosynthesis
MLARPVISIVTPTFNRRDALLRAVASTRAQTCVDFEHIIVDDASDDGSADACRQLRDPRVRVHRFERRQGANAARNQGVALARAPVVTFLDSDDEFLPQRLEGVLAILEQEPETDLVLSSFRVRRGADDVASINRDNHFDGAWLEELLMWHALYLGGSSITLRRDVARRFPWAPTLRRMQDRELLLHLAAAHVPGSTVTWARVIDAVDWIKHESADSISAPARGFVHALGDLMRLHPELMARHGLAVRYQVVRHLKTQLGLRSPRAAAETLLENARVPHFRFSLPALVAAYWQGRAIRRQMIRTGLSGTVPVAPHEIRPVPRAVSRAA